MCSEEISSFIQRGAAKNVPWITVVSIHLIVFWHLCSETGEERCKANGKKVQINIVGSILTIQTGFLLPPSMYICLLQSTQILMMQTGVSSIVFDYIVPLAANRTIVSNLIQMKDWNQNKAEFNARTRSRACNSIFLLHINSHFNQIFASKWIISLAIKYSPGVINDITV